jgi:predicted DNA-binding transcriptional regulator AlpA
MMTSKTDPNAGAKALPAELEDARLIDAKTCAAVGSMSVSWWHEKVASGEAPAPAIRQSRCTRWRLRDARDFWLAFANQGTSNLARDAALSARSHKASAAAKAKRGASAFAG